MSKNPLRLGVNIDHVATLRNARGGVHPCPVAAAHWAGGLAPTRPATAQTAAHHGHDRLQQGPKVGGRASAGGGAARAGAA